jgi:VCBS repeat protein/uncharacterized protein DUF1573/HYDIN/CFA65/VesB family protein
MRRHAIILGVVLLALASTMSSAQAPVPFINLPLIPDAVAPGGPQFVLTVNGTGFASNSVVNWNGSALPTRYVSSSQLKAAVSEADTATATTGSVTVTSPAPGGGTSNVALFSVNAANSAGFTLVSTWAVGESPTSAVVGDFNGDGNLDLAIANNTAPGTASVLLGDGTAKFSLASSPAVGSNPMSVTTGDFNRDANLDLATLNGDNSVSILLGDGAGEFTVNTFAVNSYYPNSIAVADFNQDGNLDLAVTSDGGASILMGDGAGNFTFAPSLQGWTCAVAVGDFNADNKLDLALSDCDEDVSIWLGDGAGNFSLNSTETTGYGPDALVAGDFDRNGSLDLSALNYCGEIVGYDCNPGTVSTVLGNFNETRLHSYRPISMAAGDFNGDGHLDLVVANQYGNDRYGKFGGTVSILLGDGISDFTVASTPAVGSEPTSVAVGDFNGDGKVDLAVSNSDGVSILLWDPRAVTFSPVSLTFATQLTGTASVSQPVVLTNIGSQRLRISSIVTSANFSQTNDCGTNVGAGASCTINVTFRPNGAGTLTGTITVTDNAANGSQTVALTGVATAVSLQPTGLAFGTYTVGTTSPPQTVTLTNYGSKALGIQSMHITGTDPLDFAQSNNCGSSVRAGGTCTISLTFSPKDVGKSTAKLFVADDGGASPQKVSLTGTGK